MSKDTGPLGAGCSDPAQSAGITDEDLADLVAAVAKAVAAMPNEE